MSPGGSVVTSPPAFPSPSPAEGLKAVFQLRSLKTVLSGNQHVSQQTSGLIVFSFPLSLNAFSPPPKYPTSSI